MKPSFFLVLSVFGFSYHAIAQKKASAKADKLDRFHVTLGAKAGGSLSYFTNGSFETGLAQKIRNSDTTAIFKNYTSSFLLNPIAGVFATFHFNRHWSFTPEILLAVSGQKYEYKIGYTTGSQLQEVKSFTELNYLQIPLLVEYAFGTKRLQPYVKVGVTPAFLLRAKEQRNYTITNNGQTTQNTSESDLLKLKNVDSQDNGASVATGIHLGQYFDLEARYNFGLSSLSSDVNSTWQNLRNQTGNLTLGVSF